MASVVDATTQFSAHLGRLTVPESDVQELGQILGNGAYGSVYKVMWGGSIYAAKQIHAILVQAATTPEEQTRLRENFLRECFHCSKLSHPNIVGFIGIYFTNPHPLPVMIMELMEKSLTAFMEKNQEVSVMRKGSMLLDIAEGLSYLHVWKPPIIHRDLSPNNVLVKTNDEGGMIAKISDLGVAKAIEVNKRAQRNTLTKVPGTVDYMPPEAFEEDPVYNTSLDVFSYGGVMLFVANQEWPTPTAQVRMDSRGRLIAFTEMQRRQKHLNKMTGGMEVLKPHIDSCLNNNPAKRPSMAALTETLKSLKESPPLVPALHSGHYELSWQKCADIPIPMYSASAVLHNDKLYITAGDAPNDDAYKELYCYYISTDCWHQLPSPDHCCGILQMINDKLTIIGGWNITTKEVTNKVSTYINNRWIKYYPDLLRPRNQAGVVSHSGFVIVAGGYGGLKNVVHNDIELLNCADPSQWIMASILLPQPMRAVFPTVSDNLLYIMGSYGPDGIVYSTSYCLPVDMITLRQASSDQTVQWTRLPNTPHFDARQIPNSHPPVIMGGNDRQCVTYSDVTMLDKSNNSWSKVASLSSPRACITAVPIDRSVLMVFGGCTDGEDATGNRAHSITTVEKGIAVLKQAAADSDNQCSIQ